MHHRGLSYSILKFVRATSYPRNYCSLRSGFNEQLAASGNGLNIRDEVQLGVSKSSVRYVSTSPEGWIGRGNKMGARSRGLVRLKGGGGRVGGGSQWSAHLADPTSLTSLMIYVELQAP